MIQPLYHIPQDKNPPVYHILQDKNPLFLVGCGTYAIDVYRYCVKSDIKLSGVVVTTSTDKTNFMGFDVITLEQALSNQKKISIIIGFGNFGKISYLNEIPGVETVYYLPQACYGNYSPIDKSFLSKYKIIIEDMYNKALDDLSKKCLENYFQMRSAECSEDKLEIFDYTESYFTNSVFDISNNEVFIEIGSYIGDSIAKFLEVSQNEYSKIIGIEPDPLCFDELKKNIGNTKNILLFDCCIWKEDGYVDFSPDDDLGGIKPTSSNTIKKEARSIDSLCREYDIAPTIIKLSFGFSVVDILEGMKNTILKYYPKLILRVAYFEDTFIDTCKYILQNFPGYSIKFRYTQGIPQALTIFAIKK